MAAISSDGLPSAPWPWPAWVWACGCVLRRRIWPFRYKPHAPRRAETRRVASPGFWNCAGGGFVSLFQTQLPPPLSWFGSEAAVWVRAQGIGVAASRWLEREGKAPNRTCAVRLPLRLRCEPSLRHMHPCSSKEVISVCFSSGLRCCPRAATTV